MAKINPAVKRTLLASINDRESNQIYKWVDDETLTIKELMDANINVAVLNDIHTSNFPYLLKEAVENGAHELDDLKSYGLSEEALAFIDGRSVEAQSESDEETQEEPSSGLTPEQEVLIWEINSKAITIEQIKEKLLDGAITEEILFEHTIINTKDLINRILNYKEILFSWPEPDRIPHLPKGNTDIYFFGWSASGKSCLIASLFAYCNTHGFSKGTAQFPFGDNYKNHLISRLDEGYLPEGTPTGYINYMPFILRNPADRKKQHPLNVVEMAGELFKQAAMGNIEELKKAWTFLQNGNQKALYFVIDYSLGGKSQDLALQAMFDLLEAKNIFQKTDVIYLVVTKIDLREDKSVSPDDEAVNYVKKNYKNFLVNCQECKDEYKIPIKIFPFSIGDTVSDILIETSRDLNENLDKYPKAIIKALVDDTAQKSKKGFWS